MDLPPGHPLHGKFVCKLIKSIYGLRQAAREWFDKLATTLFSLGFEQTKADYSLFVYNSKGIFISTLVYVDDILLTGTDSSFIAHVKFVLHQQFTIKDLGLVKYYLGLEVTRTSDGIYIHQHKFIHDMLVEAGLENCKPLSLHVDNTVKLSLNGGSLIDDPSVYRKLIGKLLYLTATRPDIAYIIHHLNQFLQAPHLLVVQRILRYLKGTPYQGLFFLLLPHLSLRPFVIVIGVPILILVIVSVVFVYFLVIL